MALGTDRLTPPLANALDARGTVFGDFTEPPDRAGERSASRQSLRGAEKDQNRHAK